MSGDSAPLLGVVAAHDQKIDMDTLTKHSSIKDEPKKTHRSSIVCGKNFLQFGERGTCNFIARTAETDYSTAPNKHVTKEHRKSKRKGEPVVLYDVPKQFDCLLRRGSACCCECVCARVRACARVMLTFSVNVNNARQGEGDLICWSIGSVLSPTQVPA